MLNRDFKEFVGLLNSTGVDYLLVGGYALAVHGHPRYTGDIDLWIRQTPANIAHLLTALDRFGFSSVGLSEADFMQQQAVVQLGYPPARIVLLMAIDGVDFEACWSRRLTLTVAGQELQVIHLEDFRANKRVSGRTRDLADLESLDEPRTSDPPPTSI